MAGPQRDTSEKMTLLMVEAKTLLGETGDGGIEQVLHDLPGQLGDLNEDERARIEELTRLANAGNEGQIAELAAIRQDARFEFAPSDDRMFLTLNTHPALAGGQPLTIEAVVGELKRRGITRGVDVLAIRKAVKATGDGEDVEDVLVVRGKPPTSGKADSYEFFGRRSMGRPPEPIAPKRLVGDDDNPLWLCAPDDVIARRVPAQPGQAGYNALGEPLPPSQTQGRKIHAGGNVKAQGDTFVAAVGGMVSLAADTLEVRKVLVLNEDVTRQGGPVEFDGDVRVKSTVCSGAVIKATGNIVLDGAVEDASIESTGGDIRLRRGVAGRNRGRIVAEGSVTARFAENVTIQAGGDIVIEVGSIRSLLTAEGEILVTTGRGQLFGGVAVAGGDIKVKRLGVASGLATELVLGLSREDMASLSELDEQIVITGRTQNNCGELADVIERMVGDPLKLTGEELEDYKRLRKKQLACMLKNRVLQARRDEMLRNTNGENADSKVHVLHSLLPNVRVTIGGARLAVSQARKACVLKRHKDGRRVIAQGG